MYHAIKNYIFELILRKKIEIDLQKGEKNIYSLILEKKKLHTPTCIWNSKFIALLGLFIPTSLIFFFFETTSLLIYDFSSILFSPAGCFIILA